MSLQAVNSVPMTQPDSAGAVWASSPLAPALAAEVSRLISRLDAPQRLWLSGYLAGSAGVAAVPATGAAAGGASVTILYGSHSGNCEQLAKRVGEALASRGVRSTALDMLDCRKSHLTEAQHLLVIVSTHGEGDPPERAKPLYDLLHGRKAPRLEHLSYSVLALGDSSYEKFCETGRRFDEQLEALGARRIHDRADCDVDFAALSNAWIDAVTQRLATDLASSAPVAVTSAPRVAAVATAYTRKNPFAAPVLLNQRLTARASSKDVRHIELSIEGSGIHYEPGDALGVVPRNRSADVDELLAATGFDAEAPIEVGGQQVALRDALTDHFDIGLLTARTVERYAAALDLGAIASLDESQLQQYLRGRHLIDLVVDHPPRALDAAAFAGLLRPLAPRLYSIASSPHASPDEIHLTVSVVEYESHGRSRRGVVSAALADLDMDALVQVYPHRNPAFRLPADSSVPIVMIGPGTGVAPFRAFLAEREALEARGRNWLFFGDRQFHNDFLYQAEWLAWRKRGLLTRLDVAFSRDAVQKTYVQHRMREQGADLYAWIESGAHIYVCGDAAAMAPDVEQALLETIVRHGGRSDEQAREYLQQLQRERRYQKDVY